MNRLTHRRIANAGTVFVLTLLLMLANQGAAARPMNPQEEQVATEPTTTLAPKALAQPLISYQGRLTDAAGAPLTATVTMVFTLYDAATGGAVKWGPETQSVQVTDGQFNVLLGSVTPVDSPSLTGDLWLDITVNGEHLTPRERITKVVYAMQTSHLVADTQALGRLDMNGQTITNVGMLRSPSSGSLYIAAESQDYANGWPKGGMIWLSSVNHPTAPWRGSVRVDIVKDLAVDNSPFFDIQRLQSDGTAAVLLNLDQTGNLSTAGNVAAASNLTAGGSLAVTGQGFFGGATYHEGALNLQSVAVPLTFKESDTSGSGALWRMPLADRELRFDASSNGVDFTGYNTPLRLHPNGTVSCGALAESNLQTPEERAAGGTDRFEAGDVLCWGIDRLELCSTPGDRLVQAVADGSGQPIVIGAEPVKVLGPVNRGDILVASSVPGYAMVNNDPTSGSVIAQALEGFHGERGIIKAMIRKF